LPPGYTHARTTALAGDREIRLVVEREARIAGVVRDATTRTPLRGVKVFHEHGPAGIEVVESDADGGFAITRVPTGSIRVHADAIVERSDYARNGQRYRVKALRQGWIDVEIAESGARVEGVVLLLQPPQ
jgi:hypothetical protein